MKVLVGLVSLQASLFDLQMAAFSLCPPRGLSSVRVHVCVQISSSYKDTSHMELQPKIKMSF